MKKAIYFSTLLLAGFLIASCDSEIQEPKITHKTPKLPAVSYNYAQLKLPANAQVANAGFIPVNGSVNFSTFPAGTIVNGVRVDPTMINGVQHQPVAITNEGAALGRVLFYDPNLSFNNTISCGSCHEQAKGFADGKALSPGFEGRITDRNSMAIANPITQNNLFWDSRSFSISDLSLQPVQNHIEMGMESLKKLETKLRNIDYYPALFQKAYGTPDISSERVSNAISQFVASITTSESKFDKGLSTNFSDFTVLEKHGMELFFSSKSMCSTCHSGANFSAPDGPLDEYGGSSPDGQSAKGTTNIGLDAVSLTDKGLRDGNFKIPTLRNIGLTAPYMHDGRFKTLEEVLDHYTSGIKPNKNLDKKFKNPDGSVKSVKLDDFEKKAIVAFLQTLTDTKMTTNPKYSNPFTY